MSNEDLEESLHQLLVMSQRITLVLLENDGLLTPELEKEIALLEEKLPSKIDGYRFVIENVKKEVEVWKQRAEFMTRVSKQLSNFVDRLNSQILIAMDIACTEKLEGDLFYAKKVNSKPSVVITDETMLDSKYKEIVQTVVVKKNEIYEDLSKGKEVKGTTLEQKQYVRFFANTKKKINK